MGTAGQVTYQGGRRPQGVTDILHRHDIGCFALWVRNMGTASEDGKVPGHFSVQGRAEDHVEAAASWEGQELVLPFVGGSDEGGRDCSDTDVNPPEAEYGRAIYCDAADSGPVRKGHPAARRAGSPAVMGTHRD